MTFKESFADVLKVSICLKQSKFWKGNIGIAPRKERHVYILVIRSVARGTFGEKKIPTRLLTLDMDKQSRIQCDRPKKFKKDDYTTK